MEVLEYKGVLADLPALRHDRGPQRQNHSTNNNKILAWCIKPPSRKVYHVALS